MSVKDENSFKFLEKESTPGNDFITNSEIFYNCTECPSLIEILSINSKYIYNDYDYGYGYKYDYDYK